MSVTAYSTLHSRIVPFVTRVNDALIEQMLARVAEDFFEESEVWTEEMAAINTVVDQADYAISPFYTKTRIKRVEQVVMDGSDFSYDDTLYRFDSDNTLTFDPAPTQVMSCVLWVVYVPDYDATQIESSLITRWGGVIADGTVWRIKRDMGNAQKPNPWFDPQGAEFYQERFNRGVNKARIERIDGRKSIGTKTVKIRDWV
jgi:hypothetical protein